MKPCRQLTLYFHRNPSQAIVRVGERSISTGSYVYGSSPCGDNCTYAITFQGPSLACSNTTSYQNLSLDAFFGDETIQGGDYRAAGTVVNDNFNFEVHYFPFVDLDHQFDPQQFLTCFLQKADYFVNVTYKFGIPVYNYNIADSQSLNATALLPPLGGQLSNSRFAQPAPPGANNTAAITNLNVWAIYQAMVLAMTGDVARYGKFPTDSNHRIDKHCTRR